MNPDNEGAERAMPKYQSHKQIWALRVEKCEPIAGSYLLTFLDVGYGPRNVKAEVVSRYMPKEGDYFIVYPDGYESISPKKAFEDGYTKV